MRQSWGAGAKLPGRRPPAQWTGKRRHHAWSVELFLFLFWGVWTGVWDWLCEWMSLQCHSCAQILDRGERCLGRELQYPRKRHRAPGVRVTRCQPAELLKPGRKALLWRWLERALLTGDVKIFVEHIYKCFLLVLLREGLPRETVWGASAKLSDRRPRPHWTGRGPVNEGMIFGELSFFLAFFLFCFWGVCMGVWEWMCEWMSLECHSGPWRKMSRDWPPMSAITTSSISTCPSHQESAWGA